MNLKLLLTLAVFLVAALTRADATPTRVPPHVLRALDSPDEVIVYALNPDRDAFRWWGSRWFHHYRIRGAVRVADRIQHRQVAAVLEQCATTPGDCAKCILEPRHAVRVVSQGRVCDFVICFQCTEMEVYSGDELVAQRCFRASPEPLNRILQAAHIKLAK